MSAVDDVATPILDETTRPGALPDRHPVLGVQEEGQLPGGAGEGGLAAARQRVLADPVLGSGGSLVIPAWQRYDGHLYRAASPVLADLAAASRLVILSGGYGTLCLPGVRLPPRRPGPLWLSVRCAALRADRVVVDMRKFESHGGAAEEASLRVLLPWLLPLVVSRMIAARRCTRRSSGPLVGLGAATAVVDSLTGSARAFGLAPGICGSPEGGVRLASSGGCYCWPVLPRWCRCA